MSETTFNDLQKLSLAAFLAKLEVLEKYQLSHPSLTNNNHSVIVEEIYWSLEKIHDQFENDLTHIQTISYYAYMLARWIEMEYVSASNQNYRYLQLELFETRNEDIEWIVEMLIMGLKPDLLVDLDELFDLLQSLDYNEEIFYEASVLVYYHLRAKMKFGFERE